MTFNHCLDQCFSILFASRHSKKIHKKHKFFVMAVIFTLFFDSILFTYIVFLLIFRLKCPLFSKVYLISFYFTIAIEIPNNKKLKVTFYDWEKFWTNQNFGKNRVFKPYVELACSGKSHDLIREVNHKISDTESLETYSYLQKN